LSARATFKRKLPSRKLSFLSHSCRDVKGRFIDSADLGKPYLHVLLRFSDVTFSPARICITMDGAGAGRAIKYSAALIHRCTVLGFYRSSSRLNCIFGVRFFAGLSAINIALEGLAALALAASREPRIKATWNNRIIVGHYMSGIRGGESRDLLNSRFRLHSPRSFHARAPGGQIYRVPGRISRGTEGKYIAWLNTRGTKLENIYPRTAISAIRINSRETRVPVKRRVRINSRGPKESEGERER